MRQSCLLRLSDGHEFKGELIGAPVRSSGELVFTTGMVGYSEAITDPSYFGQILTFTYPLIGNYGIPKAPESLEDGLPRGFESLRPQAAAVIFAIDSQEVFHWNSLHSIDAWLKEHGVPGIVGLDTRHLVHLIRSQHNLLGRVEPLGEITGTRYEAQGFQLPESGFFDPGMKEIIRQVSTPEPLTLGKGQKTVAVIDCGIKWNIIRQILEQDCKVKLLPWNYDFSTVEADGWLVSNGPGDPTRTGELVEQVKKIISQSKPVLGICLGHQIICLAAGATTKRMAYGHRSHNQPVYQVGTRRGHITTQNHGYVVEDHSLPNDWEPWFRNVNDQTIEGVQHKFKPIRSVQFHPEASGGPRDTAWIMEQFIAEVNT